MNSRIIYPTDEGGVAVIIPAVSIELAMKDILLIVLTRFPKAAFKLNKEAATFRRG